MLVYDRTLKTKWQKKVILLQNGGGKTLASKQLEEELKKDGLKPKRFSRREIENMVAETGNGIYLGESAEKSLKREVIKNAINESTIIKDDVKEVSKTSSAKGARDKNFFYGCQNIQNLNSLIKKPYYKGKAIENLNLDNKEIFDDLCINLNSSLFNECRGLIFSGLNKNNYPFSDENSVPDYFENSLIEMIVFVKSTKIKTCIFCGKKYRSHSSLVKALDSRYNELHFVPVNTDEGHTISCANRILSDIKGRKSSFLSNVFDNMLPKTVYQAIRIIRIYLSICYTFLDYYWKRLSSKEIVSFEKTIKYGDLLEDYYLLDKEIKETNKKLSNISTFNNFITEEVSKLIDTEGGYTVGPMKDDVGIILYKDNIKAKEKLYDVLSESQYKRLCLISLKALIRYGVIDSVILDDPVDSYDDYNKIKTIFYISDILKSSRVKNWYILTNDFESMFLMVEYLKSPAVIYLPDFSRVFNGTGDLVECECSHNEVMNYLRKNDLFYLTSYLQNNFEPRVNRDYLTCAIIMTLRNIKMEIINKVPNIIVYEQDKTNCPNKKCSAYIKTIRENKKLMNDIEILIEARAEHFSPSSSSLLTVGDICTLFHHLDPNKHAAYPHINRNNPMLYEDYRKAAAHKPIVNDHSWATVLNCLLKKMTVVSFVKYEFEKRMIKHIQSVFDSASLNKVLSEHGLYKKISRAIQINKDYAFGLDAYLKQCASIHEKYSVIYNSFDHGLIYQIMPYYSTSTKDIESLWQAVQSL